MSNNIVTLELRQKDSRRVVANGDYEVQLGREITIENGDMIAVKQAFIDTTREGNIIIPDLTLTIQNGVYFTDWIKDTTAKPTYWNEDNTANASATVAVSAGCAKFIPYKTREFIPSTATQLIEGFTYNIDFTGSQEPSFTITYQYNDVDDKPIILHTTFPPLSGRVHQTYVDKFNVICKTGTFQLVSPNAAYFAEFGTTPVGPVIGPNPSTIDIFEPYIFNTNIQLAAGSYTPTEISLLISEKLSQNNLNYAAPQFSNPIQSNFIWAAQNFDSGKPEPDGSVDENGDPITIGTNGTIFIANDGTFSTKFIPDQTYLIGSSQIALEFDTNTNSFVWQFLHMPMYDGGTGSNISVRYLQFNLDSGNLVAAANNGGIFFTGLSATTADNNAYDFWEGVLGFDVASICATTLPYKTNVFNQTGRTYLVEPLVTGQHITDGYFGLDSGIVKGATTFYKSAVVPATQAGLSSTINNTINIEAVKNVTQLLTKFSHYIIQTDLAFSNNNYIGSDNYRTFNAVVGKYFSYSTYTYGDPSTGISYVHNGGTQTIKSIKVRLLKPNKILDENLGDDSTVILQLIKGKSIL